MTIEEYNHAAPGVYSTRTVPVTDFRYLHLDDVAGLHNGRAGGRSGEDDVASLECEVLGEVGDELREREDEALCRVVLDEFSVHPGA